MIKYYNPPKAMCTAQELASLLSPVDRRRMAYRYFVHTAEKQKQSDGRTYIEALAASLRNGRSDLQPTILNRLLSLWRQIQKEWQVSQVRNTRSLEDVLCFLESRGLTVDSETVSIVHNRLRKRQSPTA